MPVYNLGITGGQSVSSGSLAGIAGTISVSGNGTTSITVDDEANAGANTYTVNGSTVGWSGKTQLSFNSNLASLTVSGPASSASNEIIVGNTAAPTPTTLTINGSSGTNNFINIVATTAGHTTTVQTFGGGTGVYIGSIAGNPNRKLTRRHRAITVTGESATNNSALYIQDEEGTIDRHLQHQRNERLHEYSVTSLWRRGHAGCRKSHEPEQHLQCYRHVGGKERFRRRRRNRDLRHHWSRIGEHHHRAGWRHGQHAGGERFRHYGTDHLWHQRNGRDLRVFHRELLRRCLGWVGRECLER